MKKIAIYEKYGINDLGDFSEISEIIEKIDIESNNQIELNLKHCFIDYPATSQIIDRILDQLKDLKGIKKLLILHDYYLPESTILNLLLLGSQFFNIQADKELKIEELKNIVNSKILSYNINLEILVVNRADKEVQKFEYGKI